jgi:non-ribosomal peptide synthetase component E (peptide arylation enzyme)
MDVPVPGDASPDLFAGRLLQAASFWELITKRAQASGQRVMLLDEHDRRVSFAGFRDRAERVAAALYEIGIGPGTRVAWQLPTRISTALVSMLMSGFPAVLVEAFHPAATAEVFRRHRVTVTGGSTVFSSALLAQQRALGPGTRLLPSLRLLTGGGAPCSPALFWAVRAELGAILTHHYGMTEVPMVCVASPADTDEQLAESDGAPIPGNRVRIADGAAVLPAGQDGEIQVQGTSVFQGYTDPRQSDAAFTPDGWLRTGDRGRLRPDGHVEVTGRIKDLIIRKGEKIAPLELETLLAEHPAVAEVAVIGLPDALRGERVCAVLTVRSGARSPALPEICGFLGNAGIMARKLPEQVEIVDQMPRTGLGKIAKIALRDRFSRGVSGGAPGCCAGQPAAPGGAH